MSPISRKLIALGCSVALLATLGVAIAPANCNEKVDFEFKNAKAFKVNEAQTLEVENTGNVEWTILMSWKIDSGRWTWPKEELQCTPNKVAPGKSCTVEVKCLEAGKLTWTAIAEAASGTKREKGLELICT